VNTAAKAMSPRRKAEPICPSQSRSAFDGGGHGGPHDFLIRAEARPNNVRDEALPGLHLHHSGPDRLAGDDFELTSRSDVAGICQESVNGGETVRWGGLAKALPACLQPPLKRRDAHRMAGSAGSGPLCGLR